MMNRRLWTPLIAAVSCVFVAVETRAQSTAAPAVEPSQAQVKTPGVVPSPPEGAPILSSPPPQQALPVVAAERYFVILFSAESVPKRARYCHTWMTVVKATPNLDVAGTYQLEVHTISWMPRTLNIRVLTLRPETGVNLDLHKTIRYCRCQGECIVMWGPYELNPTIAVEFYNKTLKQIARLNSGCVLYKCIDPDRLPRSARMCNCIHAVSDLDGVGRRPRYNEVEAFGIAAGERLARVVTGSGRVDWTVTHDWIIEALDLSKYGIRQRSLAPSR